MTAAAHLARFRPAIEAALERWLPAATEPPRELHAAMRYGVLGGGKRLRPVLVALAFEAVGGEGDGYLAPACAVEMVHAYSLIHDDLPAMDDDALRRGRPTCHVVFGEALAILAGDALLTRAFELLAAEVPDAKLARALSAELARAAGSRGLVGGQVLDLQGGAGEELLEEIPRRKTAALIRASLRLGAIAAGAPAALVERLGRFGEALGMAFQLVDDILDETATPETLGKTPGKDRRQGKVTYPAAEGLPAARRRAAAWVARARETLLGWPPGGPLLELAEYVLERDR